LDEAVKPGAEKPLTEGEIAAQQADIISARARGNDRANEIAATETKKEASASAKVDHADNHELEESVRSATEALKSTGDKSLIEAFNKMSAGLDLQQRAALLIAELATHSEARFQTIEQHLQTALNAISSLKNNHQS
jgi:hypothetical protein